MTVSTAFVVPKELETRVDDLMTRYPQKRSAALMVLHELQDQFGYLSQEAIDWASRKLDLRPINVYELVTFYPMFRQKPAGKFQIKVCRTLSCALGGAYPLHEHFCRRLGLDPEHHGVQTTADGQFSVEFVECLASCGTAPVVLCNEEFHEGVTPKQADTLVKECRGK